MQAGPERLQKLLAQLGLGSRREIEDWIRAGRLSVNGQIASLGVRAAPGDDIRLDGRPVRQRTPRELSVFLCNRSPGEDLLDRAAEEPGEHTQGSLSDAAGRKREPRPSMAARLPSRAGKRFLAVSPMPRIDGGLELLTADGNAALELQRAVRRYDMHFSVRIKGVLGPDQLRGVESGQLDRPARLDVLSIESDAPEDLEERAANQWYRLSVRGASGKDVRQLFERQGVIVSRVLRTAFGPLQLDRSLARGQHRALTAAELAALGQQLAAPATRREDSTAKRPSLKHAARRNSCPSRRGSPGRVRRGKGR
jgi:23S rRNA pseudouridine2605 synthase